MGQSGMMRLQRKEEPIRGLCRHKQDLEEVSHYGFSAGTDII